MPIITVNLLEGRDTARKRAFIREISEAAVRTLDVPLTAVRVIINEMSPEHFGVGGETKADQIKRTEAGQ